MEALEQKIIELEKKKQDLKNQINDIENNISNTDEPVQKRKQRKRGLLAEIEKIDNEINELRAKHDPSSYVDQIERMLLDEPISQGDIQDVCNLVNKVIKLKIQSNGLNPDDFILLGRVSEALKDIYLAFDYYTTGITLYRFLHIEVNEDLLKRSKLIANYIYPSDLYRHSIRVFYDFYRNILQNDKNITGIPLFTREKIIVKSIFAELMKSLSKHDLEIVILCLGDKSDDFNFNVPTELLGLKILEFYQNRNSEELFIRELQQRRPDIDWKTMYIEV